MYSKEELANDFRKLGVRAADTVRLQASVRAAGKVAGGPDYIHLALKMENGCRVWRAIEEFDTSSDSVHATWPDRFFAKIVDSFLTKTRNNGARVGPYLAPVNCSISLYP
jgi:hypothetical protein